jgi:hypothetical protein
MELGSLVWSGADRGKILRVWVRITTALFASRVALHKASLVEWIRRSFLAVLIRLHLR